LFNPAVISLVSEIRQKFHVLILLTDLIKLKNYDGNNVNLFIKENPALKISKRIFILYLYISKWKDKDFVSQVARRNHHQLIADRLRQVRIYYSEENIKRRYFKTV